MDDLSNFYISTLKELCGIPGISGNENETGISKFVMEKLLTLNPNTTQDEFGNVISIFGNGEKKILFDAHLDEIGFMITKANPDGIFLTNIGDINLEKNNGAESYIIKKNVQGRIITSKNHISFIPDNPANKGFAKPGDLVSFQRIFSDNNGLVTATALDNRVGCAALIELLRDIRIPHELTVIVVFSTQEEQDNSTLDVVVKNYNPQFGIVVDAAYCKPIDVDYEETSIPEQTKGCAIQYFGKDFIVNKGVIKLLEKLADDKTILHQPEIPQPNTGRTNFNHFAKNGVLAGVVNIPVQNQHTNFSQVAVFDALQAIKLLREVIVNFRLFIR